MPSKLDKVRYRLPENLRDELKRPIGHILDEKTLISYLRKRDFIVSVGDMVTATILKYGVIPKIAIIDFRCKRRDCGEEIYNVLKDYGNIKIKVKNPASVITEKLWNAVKKAYEICKEKTVCIIVDGEEDMASLIAILFAPSSGTVIYGLPNKGVILVDVTEREKDMVYKVLEGCDKYEHRNRGEEGK